ncbi:MAG: C25 family cysteine peptidase [Sumerlaeia bacterium]
MTSKPIKHTVPSGLLGKATFGFSVILLVSPFLFSCAGHKAQVPLNLNNQQNQPHVVRNRSAANQITFGAFVTPIDSLLKTRSWILAAPGGEYSWKVTKLRLHNLEAPGSIQLNSLQEFEELTGIPNLDAYLTIRDLGIWRNNRLLTIVANTNNIIRVKKGETAVRHKLVEFEVEVHFTESTNPSNAQQYQFVSEKPEILPFLQAQVANPEGVALYALNELPKAPALHPEALVPKTPWGETPIPREQWKAFPVTTNNLYALDGRWLRENGFDPSTTKPEQVVLYSRGQRVPLLLLGGEPDTPFASGGRVAFWGQKSSSRETNARVYYVAVQQNQATPLLISPPKAEPLSTGAQVFQRTLRLEEDNTLEKQLGNFLTVRDMTWVWAPLNPKKPTEYQFNLPGLPNHLPEAKAQLAFYQSQAGLNGADELEFFINGTSVGIQQINSKTESLEITIPQNILQRLGNILTIKSSAQTPNPSLGAVFLDSIELQHESLFRGDDGRLEFQFSENDAALTASALQLSNFRFLQTRVVDLQNPDAPLFVPLYANALEGFIAPPFSVAQNLLVFEQDRLERAPDAQGVTESAMSFDQPVQTLIISHPDFLDQANRLSESINAHWPERGFTHTFPQPKTVHTINSNSIYHDHSGGELSSEAIRHYLAELIRMPNGKTLEHVILMGDCTSDGQRVTRNNVLNYIPTYTYEPSNSAALDPYACDAYYSWLVGEDQVADLFVSRISVGNSQDAAAYVDKAVEHMNQPSTTVPQEWKNRVFALSDSEAFSPALEESLPTLNPAYQVDHVRSYDAIWEDNYYLPESVLIEKIAKVSPVLTRRIADAFNQGVGTIFYMGHGSPNIWSNQRIWFGGDSESSDNLLLNNQGMYPFVATFTCNNGAIDYPIPRWNVTIIEDMMRQKSAGSIAAFTPSGPGYTRNHMALFYGLMRQMNQPTQSSYAALGEAARLHYQSLLGPDDQSRMFLTLGAGSLQMQPQNLSFATNTKPTYTTELKLQNISISENGEEVILHVLNDNPSAVSTKVFLNELSPQVITKDYTNKSLLAVERIQPYSVAEMRIPIFEVSNSKVVTGVIENPIKPLEFQYTTMKEFLPNQKLKIAPSIYTKNKSQVTLLATNPTTEALKIMAETRFQSTDDSELYKSTNHILQPSTQQNISVTVNSPKDFSIPIFMSVTLYDLSKNENPVPLETKIFSTDPQDYTDLALLEDSIIISPENPTAGATIFVEGFVENRSSVISAPTRIALYSGADSTSELPTKAPHPLANLKHIMPGEKGFFRTRWDPTGVTGSHNLRVVLDPDGKVLETSKTNNVASLPISIRTKWNLAPAGIGLQPLQEQGVLQLTATVKNQGETAAHEVVVLFYSTEEQTDETLIGQAPINVVPAGEERVAEFNWDVRSVDPTTQVKPSFAISLRGSRQRISSVTD